MAETCTLEFVGWDRPLLHALRDMLLREPVARLGTAPDLSSCTVVLPGARAGRRLIELLVERAPGRTLVPPRVLTLEPWMGLGAPTRLSRASDVTRLLGWAAALRSLPADLRGHIGDVDPGDALGMLDLARVVDRAHTELCAEGLTFGDVARRVSGIGFGELERWAALSAAQAHYREGLERVGLGDPHLERAERCRTGQFDLGGLGGAGRVILAGLSEMSAAARAMGAALGERCTIVVPAPETERDRFDTWGRPGSHAWADARFDLAPGSVRACEDPQSQAVACLRLIAEHGAGRPADEITIGVPDAEVEEQLRRLSGRVGGVPVRRAEGTPVSFTRPVKLLLGAAEYAERRDFLSLAALVRHPDVEGWIGGLLASRGMAARPERWLPALDEYHATHLHGRVDGAWLTSDPDAVAVLDALHDGVHALLGDLVDGSERPLQRWAAAVWDVVRRAYSGFGSGMEPAALDPVGREACNIVREFLTELAELPASLGGTAPLAAHEVLRFVVTQGLGVNVPESGDEAAVDMVGWLELALDDAPRLLVTGMNEGRAPVAPATDPLLPEPLRREMGLRDRASRGARDALALTLMGRSRAPGATVFLFGKRSGAGDPLAPSRLLLMGDDGAVAERVRQWTGESADPDAGDPLIAHAKVSRFDVVGRVLERAESIDEMGVTSFRDYLASPYVFYLRHVLRLREVEDAGAELDALGFGNLLHAVLQTLVAEPVCCSRDAEQISSFLLSQLEAVARQSFGEEPAAEVWVQLEQARARLRAFALAQAAWAAQGWRVARTEWEPPRRSASLAVDEKKMYLRGRIDRIDVHADGRWAIIDYKTGNAAPTEKDARGRDGAWRNPQLPLYRHLAAGLRAELGVAADAVPVLAWVALPGSLDETGFVVATWDEAALRSADDAAAEVVRRVRRGEFGEIGAFPACDGVVGLLCGGLELEGGEE